MESAASRIKNSPTVCQYYEFQALGPLLSGPSIIFIHYMDYILLVQYDSNQLEEDFQWSLTILNNICLKQFCLQWKITRILYNPQCQSAVETAQNNSKNKLISREGLNKAHPQHLIDVALFTLHFFFETDDSGNTAIH